MFGISDRVFAWENWGKVIDDNFALNVGLTTPKALRLLDESGLLEGKHAVTADMHVGGYAFERINDHACKVTFLGCMDLKGRLPYWMANKALENQAIETYTQWTKQLGCYIDKEALKSERSVTSQKRLGSKTFGSSKHKKNAVAPINE